MENIILNISDVSENLIINTTQPTSLTRSGFININEVTETIVYKSNKIQILVSEITLFKKATIDVYFYDKNDDHNIFRVEKLQLNGDDYTNWLDDTYITAYVLNKLNLTQV